MAPGAVAVFVVSAYGLGCDAPGPHTKLGTVPALRWTVAADWSVLKPGTIVHVEGLGARRVEDIGAQVKGHQLDLFMDCEAARKFGRQKRSVAVLRLPGEEWSRRASAGATGLLSGGSTGDDRVADLDRQPVDSTPVEPLGDADFYRLLGCFAVLLGTLALAEYLDRHDRRRDGRVVSGWYPNRDRDQVERARGRR